MKRPAAPTGSTARPAAPAGTRAATKRKPIGATAKAVRNARTTIPTCLVLAGLLTVLGLVRLVVPESSAWAIGTTAVGVFLLLVGLVAAGCAAILMRLVMRHLA